MIIRIINWNKKISYWIEKKLPQYQFRIFGAFNHEVVSVIDSLTQGAIIVDIGGGRRSPFAKHINTDIEVIGVDISDEELKLNKDLSRFVVCDVTKHLPFEDNSVDLIMSRSVVEHLDGVDKFLEESYRVLKPGGKCIHLFPSKFAPFSIANMMLPNVLAKKILYKLHPHQVGLGGFKAYYQYTYHPAFPNALKRAGFKVELSKAGYYQSNYFSFCVPLYLISATYEVLLHFFNIRLLGANLLVVARK